MHDALGQAPAQIRQRQPLVVVHVSSQPDVLLFAGATAVLALHAVLDSFVAPEPGVSPRDHLLRGLASLGLLTLLIVAYPRLRAGGRAAFAAILGALAVEGAALAIEDARAGGAR